jgi:hypothetical protein
MSEKGEKKKRDRNKKAIHDQYIPIRKGVLDVVLSSVDQNTTLVPRAALHSAALTNRAALLQLSGGDGNC